MIGSSGICSFLGWEAELYVGVEQSGRNANIITPSPPIAVSPATFDPLVTRICILNPEDSKGKGDLDRAMLMKSAQVPKSDCLIFLWERSVRVCGWPIGLFCKLIHSQTRKLYLEETKNYGEHLL